MSGTSGQPAARVRGDDVVGSWIVDPSHSTVGFEVVHLGLTAVKGIFTRFDGRLDIHREPGRSAAQGHVEAGSLTTHLPERDAHLLSHDFLDAERFPGLEWFSDEVRLVGRDRWELDGPVTIRGITRQITFAAELLGVAAADEEGGRRLGLTARAELDRRAFGLEWAQSVDGSPLAGFTATLLLEISALSTQPAA